ncbi:hypothetical protein [Corynebacterium pacaense]|uniref:hypothetical protein n=1 Tax=Corynebacterium pacaense TaxID=1816684 RepID=UPI0009BC4267|nr:hypothetical protein [Corynebacterium pacaense]
MKYLTLATVIAGLSGFVVIIIAGRALGDSSTLAEEFTAYWGLFFAGTGVLTGLTQETTRAISAARSAPDAPRGSIRPIVFSLFAAAATAVILGATTPLWIGRLLSDHQGISVAMLALGLGSYAVQATISGILSGCQLWKQYAALISLDTGVRMILAVAAWLLGYQLLAFLVITVIGAVSWIFIVAGSREARAALSSITDVSAAVFTRQALTAMAASGATAVLITGFPTLVKLTNPDTTGQAVTAAAVIYAVTLTRAPLLVPLQQFQSAIIVRFVQNRQAPLRALAAPLLIVWTVGLIGAGLAWLIGPWLLEVLLAREIYAVPGSLLAVLTLGATSTATLMVTGCASIAYGRHGLYLGGWLMATAVAIGLLLGPWELATAAGLALICGPLAGLVVHAAALLRSGGIAEGSVEKLG